MSFVPPVIHAPRLAGTSLRALAALAGAPGIGAILRGQMLTQFGIDAFRGAHADGSPAPVPWPHPDPTPTTGDEPAGPRGFHFPTLAEFPDPVATARRVLANR